MRRPPRLRARFATAGTGEGEGETSSGFVSSSDFDFASPEVAFADGLGVFFSPAPGGSGEARDAGGACLLLGAIPRARRRGRCASGTRESGGWRETGVAGCAGRVRGGSLNGAREKSAWKDRGKIAGSNRSAWPSPRSRVRRESIAASAGSAGTRARTRTRSRAGRGSRVEARGVGAQRAVAV